MNNNETKKILNYLLKQLHTFNKIISSHTDYEISLVIHPIEQ